MEQQTINKYTKGFSKELLEFIIYIEELFPTETNQKILNNYQKINVMRVVNRYYNIMSPLKDRVTNRDETIFNQPLFIVPEFNLSFFWENMPKQHRDHVWKTLSRLMIYANILKDATAPPPQPQPVVTPPVKEVNPYIGIGEDNNTISVASLQDEVASGKVDGNPIMKAIKNKLNIDELSKQLKNVDKESIAKMTDEVKKIISPHVDDPQVSGLLGDMLTNIGDELKNTDLTNGNLFESMLQIAEKMSTKLATDATGNRCSPEKLLASTQSIMSSIGMPANMNPADMMSGNGFDPSMIASLMANLSGGTGKSDDPMSSIMGMLGGMMKK